MSNWKVAPKRHIIKKRQAFKIETLQSVPDERPIQVRSKTHTAYFTKKEKKINCVICGQPASYLAVRQ